MCIISERKEEMNDRGSPAHPSSATEGAWQATLTRDTRFERAAARGVD
jgi:hypothetical protein